MIQGTMSNAGKSLIAAALCRIFAQDGYKVAPFKSQNMALNSFITKDGLEMGRAQAMQAEAAGVEPSVYMNPILLKPTTDVGSQVIVNGVVRGNEKAKDYFKHKKELIPDILKAFSKLEEEYDIIVIEGAGSPAELNLKRDDIVNMGLAKLLNAPVLLVGDIDRGGVFAQLIGTVDLLEQEERNLIRGLLVNKFRGDATLFVEGKEILEEKSKKPVLGLIPYVDCDIEEEDSLGDKLENDKAGVIDIAVIKLPHISNYTDFDVFLQYEGVKVRYVKNPHDLKTPDMIILPGTKSTIADLKWLKESGFSIMIGRAKNKNIPIFGICGGYQMLGKKIIDPLGVESGNEREVEGLGFLDCVTTFVEEKETTQVEGNILSIDGAFANLSHQNVTGYEIHMGQTVVNGKPFVELADGRTDGCVDQNVYGTYLHGVFDEVEMTKSILSVLFEQKGLPFSQEGINRKKYKEMQYDKLASEVRKALDMEQIYAIMD